MKGYGPEHRIDVFGGYKIGDIVVRVGGFIKNVSGRVTQGDIGMVSGPSTTPNRDLCVNFPDHKGGFNCRINTIKPADGVFRSQHKVPLEGGITV